MGPHSAFRRRLAATVLGSALAGALLVWLMPQLVLFALAGWVQAETGRSLVADKATIGWGREITLDLRGVRLANARWSRAPWMLAIDHLRLRASLGALLQGQGELVALELDGAELLLEVHAGGAPNWEFVDRPSPFMALGGAGGLPRIDALQVRNMHVRFHDPAREQDILGTVTGAAGSLGTPGWRIQGQGMLDFKALTFQLQGRGDELDVALDLGDTSLLARGSPRDGRFAVEAHGADLRHAFPVIPIPFPSTPAYRFQGQLARSATGWQLRGLTGVLGDTDIAGTLDITPGSPGSLSGQIHSHTLHLGDLKGFLGIPVRGPPRKREKIFPEKPINRQRLSRLQLTLDYNADRVIDGHLPLQGLATRLTIEEGRLQLAPFRITLADGPAHGSLSLDLRGPLPQATLQLDLDGGRLKELFARLPLLDASRGRLRGALRLEGRGASPADIFGSSNGELVLLMTGGALDRRFVDTLNGDLLQLLFKESKGKTADLSCAVAVFHVEQGVARADAVVAETSRALITGKGKIDLGRERLDLTLAAAPRETSALTAPTPLTLEGSFSKPKLAADTSELAGRAAAAVTLGALVGPLAALAPLTTEGSDHDGECAHMLHG